MKGRESDQWQTRVAALPIHEQLQAAADAGFKGIQVARRGYVDQGQAVEQQLRSQLGVDPIVSDDEQDSFFSLDRYLASLPTNQR